MTVLGVLSTAWFGLIFGAIWGYFAPVLMGQHLDPWAGALIGALLGGSLTSAIGYSWRVDR